MIDPRDLTKGARAASELEAAVANLIRVIDTQNASVRELENALEFYANPAVYAPHPHGLGFDRRDISYRAKNALARFRGGER